MSRLNHDMDKNTKVINIRPIRSTIEQPSMDTSDSKLLEEQQITARNELKEAKKQADTLISQAHEQIKIEKEKWDQEKTTWINQAKEEGYNDGFQVGKQESQDQYAALINQAKQIIELSKNDYKKIIDQSEDVILQLGIRAASKIIRLKLDEETVFIQLVKDVLKEVKDQSSIKIITDPEDYQLILKHKEELMTIVNGRAELYIYPDNDLFKGSCIIETPFGKIDASVDSQLQEIRNKLYDLAQEEDREHSSVP